MDDDCIKMTSFWGSNAKLYIRYHTKNANVWSSTKYMHSTKSLSLN